MGTAPQAPKTPFEKWQDTVKASQTDSRWNEHDSLIAGTVDDFNKRLGAQWSEYQPLDRTIIKAMAWTESGGPENIAWRTRPMQIGNPGDPGLKALLAKDDGGELILTPAVRKNSKVEFRRPERTFQPASRIC